MLTRVGENVGHIHIPHKGRKGKSKHGRTNKQNGVWSKSISLKRGTRKRVSAEE